MVNFVSPGVYVIEKDISDYTPAINPTVVGIVGFASKGPINKATLITNQERLVKTFGRPSEALAGQGIEGLLEILETANQTYFVRAADPATSNDACAVMALGGGPVVGVSANEYGITNSLYLTVQVTDNNGIDQFVVPKQFSIPAGTVMANGAPATNQLEAMKVAFGGNLDADDIGVYFVSGDADANPDVLGAFIVGNYAGAGAKITVKSFADATFTEGALGTLVPLNASGQASAADGDDVYEYLVSGDISSIEQGGYSFESGSATDGDGLGYLVESLYPGQGYNLSTLPDGTILGNSITVSPLGFQNFVVNVNDLGITEESFKASLVASGAYIEDVINTGGTDLASEFIKGNLIQRNALFSDVALPFYQRQVSALGATTSIKGSGGAITTPMGSPSPDLTDGICCRFVKLVEGTDGLVGGANGDGNNDTDAEAAALIGGNYPSRTGMQALNEELVPITLAAVPGITAQAVQNNLITLAETTGNFLAVLGTPIGIGDPADALDYANGQSPYRTSPFNSSYACLYYPAVKIFQPYLGTDIFMDPGVFAIRQMGYTDTVADLWFAPAGFVRGRLTKPFDTEVEINQGDRDSLYSGGNIINPICNFPQQGITIFGQRTTQRSPTALDRINVRRLMVYIKRVITASTQRFIFEPNDKITQERIQTLLIPLFEDIKRRRGITEFKVICDETVNTPVRVDRNELWCKVLIKPTKAAEVLVFELNVTSQVTNISG